MFSLWLRNRTLEKYDIGVDCLENNDDEKGEKGGSGGRWGSQRFPYMMTRTNG